MDIINEGNKEEEKKEIQRKTKEIKADTNGLRYNLRQKQKKKFDEDYLL